MKQLTSDFFNRRTTTVAKALLGKCLMVRDRKQWLSALIIETEAYCKQDKASHGSLGYTEKRKALFMTAGTIYMYYARGGDSLNISCSGEGNAVLIKSGFAYPQTDQAMIQRMQQRNPKAGLLRHPEQLCSGQTLLCRSLGLTVRVWDQQTFDPKRFYIADPNDSVPLIIQTTRLGITKGRDEQLPYRFIDHRYAKFCTKNPLTQRNPNYRLLRR